MDWWAGQSLRENDETSFLLTKMLSVTDILLDFVFAYNFYVYLITGKRFRSELRDLFRRCLPSSSSPPPAAAAAAAAAAVAMVDAGNDV